MFWPRFRLTPDEHKYNGKYEGELYTDPQTKVQRSKPHVLRRIYAGELVLSPTIRQDVETLQISRRCRVMGLTASGDVNQVEIQITDITGEQFTTDFIPMCDLIGGSNWDPRGSLFYQNPPTATVGLDTGYVFNNTTYAPFIFEPNIVLAPNQTLSFTARFIDPTRQYSLVSFCLHVYEFPGMPGSPL